MKRRLTYPQFADQLPIGKTKFFELKKDGIFPAGMVAEGKSTVFWYQTEVDAWLAAYDAGLTKQELWDHSRKIECVRELQIARAKAVLEAELDRAYGDTHD